MGPRAGLDGRKIPARPALSSVAIPTELPGPREIHSKIHLISRILIINNNIYLNDNINNVNNW